MNDLWTRLTGDKEQAGRSAIGLGLQQVCDVKATAFGRIAQDRVSIVPDQLDPL